MERYQVDNVVVPPFTILNSPAGADEYIQKFLVEKFHPKYIVIGYDHRFGLNRQGRHQLPEMARTGRRYKVIEIPKHEVENMAVSSTKIRNAMGDGDVESPRLLHAFT